MLSYISLKVYTNFGTLPEPETNNLSGIKVDAVVMLIKWMSHSMFYKVKASSALSHSKIIMCNTKNIDTILQKMYDELL